MINKELTSHQRGVILRGICNSAVLRGKQAQIGENNMEIVCEHPLSAIDICSISCDSEAFGLKADFHYDGKTRIVFSEIEQELPDESAAINKPTVESIRRDYFENSDVCMGEYLDFVPANGLSMEEAFLLYIAVMKKHEEDEFYKVVEGETIEL